MKNIHKTAILISALTLVSPSVRGANMFVDSGFEGTLTTDGAPFVGSWEGFSGGGAASLFDTAMPRTGAQHLQMNMDGNANAFAGAFQDIPIIAGSEYIYSGWHKGAGITSAMEIRIEWRDSVGDVEISRTPNHTPGVGTSYEMFSLTATAPAGADTARVIYATQSFGGDSTASISADDLSFDVVPEPSSTALLALGSVVLILRRRK